MDEQTKQEMARLLLQQVAIDEAKGHQCRVHGKQDDVFELLDVVARSDYKYIHPAWGVELYLRRN